MSKGLMLSKAISLAANAHSGQVDRGGQPYILHPLAVMQSLNSQDEELLCIAVLHDTVEDSGVTYQQLRDSGMSERVVANVRLLTKHQGQSYEEYKEAVKSSRDACLVKLADLRHNSDLSRIKGVTPKDLERNNRYFWFAGELRARLEELN